jgi:hypothetical protein
MPSDKVVQHKKLQRNTPTKQTLGLALLELVKGQLHTPHKLPIGLYIPQNLLKVRKYIA